MPYTIEVDLSLLKEAVKAMGAEDLDVLFEKLKKGIVVDLSEIESINGLTSYKGRQTLFYIQDHSHGNMFEKAIEDGSKGNKFHVTTYCRKYREMYNSGRGNRYVVINNRSGKFIIKGENDERGEAKLQVCKLCLEKLNYEDYCNADSDDKAQIVQEFHIPYFFELYGSCFPPLPNRRAGAREGYTDSWEKKSWRYKKGKKFTCEECSVKLRSRNHHKLLHTHHINGDKSDNSEENLRALCVDCHSRQKYHGHMKNNEIFRKSFEQIKKLRQEQGLPQFDLPELDLSKLFAG